jgi:hypothetical protein
VNPPVDLLFRDKLTFFHSEVDGCKPLQTARVPLEPGKCWNRKSEQLFRVQPESGLGGGSPDEGMRPLISKGTMAISAGMTRADVRLPMLFPSSFA